MGLSPFTGTVKAQGKGTDLLSPHASANITARIRRFRFQKYDLDGLNGDISKKGDHVSAHVQSSNRMIAGDFTYQGRFSQKLVDGHLRGWLRRVDSMRWA